MYIDGALAAEEFDQGGIAGSFGGARPSTAACFTPPTGKTGVADRGDGKSRFRRSTNVEAFCESALREWPLTTVKAQKQAIKTRRRRREENIAKITREYLRPFLVRRGSRSNLAASEIRTLNARPKKNVY